MTEEIYCIPVQFSSGEVVFVPATEYRNNPEFGSYEVRERRNIPEPITVNIGPPKWRKL